MSAERTPSSTKGLSVRLDDAALGKILDDLDRRSDRHPDKGKRVELRHSYRRNLIIQLVIGGETLSFRAPSRDISRRGLSALHGGYVHPGTACRVQLVTVHNNWQPVAGTVVRCQYIEGRIHELGVQFDQAVDVTTFAAGAVARRILVVDDEPATVRLLSHYLQQLNVQVVTGQDGEQAIKKAAAENFDLLLMDIDMPLLDGLTAMKRLREKGYQGRIVAATSLTGPGERERLLGAGFDAYLGKPISRDALEELVAGLNDEPLYSTLASDPDMKELVNQFVADLSDRIHNLEEALAKEDLAALQRLARNLKGEAGSYGFEPLTAAAQAVEAAANMGELSHQVNDLIKLCRLVRPIAV